MNRYPRQTSEAGIGADGQQHLANARVLVVGAGALGSVAAMYLAGAGVGEIVVADFDTVDVTNLQRQVFYAESDCGKYKAEVLAERIRALSSDVRVEIHKTLVCESNFEEVAKDCRLVLEATDNAKSKTVIAGCSRKVGLPCVMGRVSEWRGQVTAIMPESEFDYAAYFGEDERECAMMGDNTCGTVIGPVAGITATAMATEAIKILTGKGMTLAGQMLAFDARNLFGAVLDL